MLNKRVLNKIVLLTLFFIVICILMNSKLNVSYGSTLSIHNNREPRITCYKKDKNYLYIYLHDASGIKTSKTVITLGGKNCKLQLLEVTDGIYTSDGRRIKDIKRNGGSYSGKQYDYGVKINKSDLSPINFREIYIYAFDHGNSCFIKETFSAKKLDKASENGDYFLVDRAPRLSIHAINNRVKVDAIDYSGIKSIKILSKKSNEVIYSFQAGQSNSNSSNQKGVTKDNIFYPIKVVENIDMNLIEKAQKDEPGRYRFRIFVEDISGMKSEKTMTTHVSGSSYSSDSNSENNTSEVTPNRSITLNPTSLFLSVGETYKLSVSVSSKTNTKITWSTNNNKVAKVDSNGNVTAVANGTATIRVTLPNGKSARCSVTVGKKGSNNKKLNGHKISLPNGDDRIYFLDVSDKHGGRYQGSDAIVLESNGQFALIDVAVKYQRKRVIKYLRDLGVTKLEFILITHAHYDHMGALNDVIGSGIKVDRLYIKDLSDGKSEYRSRVRDKIKNARKHGTYVLDVKKSQNQICACGDLGFRLYNTVDRSKRHNLDENLNSVAALTVINGRRLYFTGDIQNKSGVNAGKEAAKAVGKVDFYKVAHHGYRFNAHTEDLKTINPKYAVITNHPNRRDVPPTIEKLYKYTRVNKDSLYYTATGTVILTISQEGNMLFNKLGEDK